MHTISGCESLKIKCPGQRLAAAAYKYICNTYYFCQFRSLPYKMVPDALVVELPPPHLGLRGVTHWALTLTNTRTRQPFHCRACTLHKVCSRSTRSTGYTRSTDLARNKRLFPLLFQRNWKLKQGGFTNDLRGFVIQCVAQWKTRRQAGPREKREPRDRSEPLSSRADSRKKKKRIAMSFQSKRTSTNLLVYSND